MKRLAKKYFQISLRWMAHAILNRYQPKVIAITGSVGKTSTKDAITTVVEARFRTRASIKNYNNELGVPLSIIGSHIWQSPLMTWLSALTHGLGLIVVRDRNYPEVLVLEMGADHPGDLAYLTSFVPIDIAVVTSVAPVHLEFFRTIERIADEKAMIVKRLRRGGTAILNHDDPRVAGMAVKTHEKVVTFGMTDAADVLASDIAVSHDVDYRDIATIQGTSFKLAYRGSTIPVLLPHVIGNHLVSSALAATAVGISLGINLHTIAERLKEFKTPKGRMHLLMGIKHTLLIDDTYNASPLSTRMAVRQLTLLHLPQPHHAYAVLGDMLELGSYSEQGHYDVGRAVHEFKVDVLITVGERARDIVRGAVGAGMKPEACFNFSTVTEAGQFIQERIHEGDILLIKGSQGMRMEKIVKELMAEPQRAAELLVRQEPPWV